VADTVLGWRFPNPAFAPEWIMGLGETAEVVAREFGVPREAQDGSPRRASGGPARPSRPGASTDEIVPVSIPQRRGPPVVVDADEHPRPDTTAEALARLRPVFTANGTVSRPETRQESTTARRPCW
jgi:acetyl-CoA acyltransferase